MTTTKAPPPGFPEVGLELGPYRLTEGISRGGMGTVYRARRVDGAFDREVAVKLLRPRSCRAEDLRRFQVEGQVLARLDHENIARLLDSGTTDDGRSYLVMELVDGLPIDRFCAVNDLEPRARVLLFQQVCAAIEVAHQNLVIHRDIKPGNILVTGRGVVKVLDFGIVKLLDPEAVTGSLPKTRPGTEPMTPGYASPEQIRGQPVTTRSEVFVLGALLYELLTGVSPFTGGGELPHEIENTICAIDGLPAGRHGRLVAPARRALRGDLGSIVGKALRADPDDRYGSVEALSDDLSRWAEQRPVAARPDRRIYRLRKLVQRQWRLMTLGTIALVSLSALSVALVLQTEAATNERDRAERALSFVAGMFAEANTGRANGPPSDSRELLDRSTARIERTLGEDLDMQLLMLDAIGKMYTSLGWYDAARERLEQSLAVRRRQGGHPAELADCLFQLGVALDRLGDYELARARFDESLSIRRRLFGPEDPAVARALAARADTDLELGRYAQAEPDIREALRIRRSRLGDDHLEVAESLSSLGNVLYMSQTDMEGVQRAFEEALAIRETALGEEHLLVADSLHNVAQGLFHGGHGLDALPLLRRAVEIKRRLLSDDHPDVARLLASLGGLARITGSLDLAEPSLREALALAEDRLGAQHPEVAGTRLGLGILLIQTGRLAEAEAQLLKVREIYEASYEADHPAFNSLWYWQGDLLRRRGDFAAARRHLDEAWRAVDGYIPAGTIVRATVMVGRGRLEIDSGDTEAALALFKGAWAIMRERGKPVWFLGEVEAEVGRCLARLGRVEAGRATIVDGLAKLESERPANDPKILRAREYLRQIDLRNAAGATPRDARVEPVSLDPSDSQDG